MDYPKRNIPTDWVQDFKVVVAVLGWAVPNDGTKTKLRAIIITIGRSDNILRELMEIIDLRGMKAAFINQSTISESAIYLNLFSIVKNRFRSSKGGELDFSSLLAR